MDDYEDIERELEQQRALAQVKTQNSEKTKTTHLHKNVKTKNIFV